MAYVSGSNTPVPQQTAHQTPEKAAPTAVATKPIAKVDPLRLLVQSRTITDRDRPMNQRGRGTIVDVGGLSKQQVSELLSKGYIRPTFRPGEYAPGRQPSSESVTAETARYVDAKARELGAITETKGGASYDISKLLQAGLKPEYIERAGIGVPSDIPRDVASRSTEIMNKTGVSRETANAAANAEQQGLGKVTDKSAAEALAHAHLVVDTAQKEARTAGKKPAEVVQAGVDALDVEYRQSLATQKDFDNWVSTLPKKYQDIYNKDGYDKLMTSITTDQASIEKYRLTSRQAGEIVMTRPGAPEAMSNQFNLQAAIQDVVFNKISRDALEMAFGTQAVQDAYKVYLVTHPTIGKAGEPPVLTKEQYVKMTSPASFTDAQIKAVSPFVLTGEKHNEVDIEGMLKAKVDPKTVYEYMGGRTSGATLTEIKQQAKYLTARPDEKVGIVFDTMKAQIAANPSAPLLLAADIVVPGVYVARNWNQLSVGEKAFFLAIDVVSVVPIATEAAAGARAVAVAGRGARFLGAMRGAGRGAISLVRAPVDMIIHPIATGKATFTTVRSMIENIASSSKIPEAVVTTADGLVMLRISEDTTAAEAFRFQEQLIEAAGRGQRPIIKIGDTTVELVQSPLMREVGGGVVHAAPDVTSLAKGTEVVEKTGKAAKEQGLFVAHQPTLQFALKPGDIPLAGKATGKMTQVAKYKAADLVKLDAPALRPLNLADAASVPVALAQPFENYIRTHDGLIAGSFVEWLKVPKAPNPHDLDLVFADRTKAISDLIDIAKSKGFKVREVEKGLEAFVDNKWVRIAEIRSTFGYEHLIPVGLTQSASKIEGVSVTRLGEQYLRQSLGSVVKPGTIEQELKVEQRIEKLDKASAMVLKKLKAVGATVRQPGFIIYSPETAAKAEATRKMFFSKEAMKAIGQAPTETVEMEEKFLVKEILPKMKQRLFTRVGPTGEKVEIWLENPLSRSQIAKLKAEALVEIIKTPFKPAITVSKARGLGLTEEETAKLAGLLRESDNAGVARTLERVEGTMRSGMSIPRSAAVLAPRAVGLRLSPPSLTRIGGMRPAERIARPVETITRRVAMERPPEIVRIQEQIGRLERIAEADRTVTQQRELTRQRANLERETARFARETYRASIRGITGRPPTPPVIPRTPQLVLAAEMSIEEKRQAFAGAITWRQGFGWWAIKRPYQSREHDVAFFYRIPPPKAKIVKGGAGSAYRSIQALSKGEVPDKLIVGLGITNITIQKPSTEPGKEQAITYTAPTTAPADIEIRKSFRGESSVEGLRHLPLATTLKQLLTTTQKKPATQKFAEEKSLPRLLMQSTSQEIATAITEAGLTKPQIAQVLKHVPDRQRGEIRFILNHPTQYAPTKGWPKARIPLRVVKPKKTFKVKAIKSKDGKSKIKMISGEETVSTAIIS